MLPAGSGVEVTRGRERGEDEEMLVRGSQLPGEKWIIMEIYCSTVNTNRLDA